MRDVKTFVRYSIVCISAIGAQASATSEWEAIGTSGGAAIEIHRASMTRSHTMVEAWIRWSLPKPQTLKTASLTFQSVAARYQFGCQQGTAGLLRTNLFADRDFTKQVKSVIEPGTPEMKSVASGSTAEAMLKAACQLR